jgi:hypothetical protein
VPATGAVTAADRDSRGLTRRSVTQHATSARPRMFTQAAGMPARYSAVAARAPPGPRAGSDYSEHRFVKLILRVTGTGPSDSVTVCRSSLAVIGLPEQAILLSHHGGMIMNLNIECIYCSESLLSQVFGLTLRVRRSARPSGL